MAIRRKHLQDIPEAFLRYTPLPSEEDEPVLTSSIPQKKMSDSEMLFLLLILLVFYE